MVRFLNGGFTGGYATLPKEVVVMKRYIIRILFLVLLLLITFAIKAE